ERARVAYATVDGSAMKQVYARLLRDLTEGKAGCRTIDNGARVAMVVMSQYPSDPRVRREAEALEKEGMLVHIICLRGADERRVETLGHVTAYRVLRVGDKARMPRYLWLTGKFLVVSFWVLLRLWRRHRYQLCQVHNMPDYLVFAPIWLRICGVPVVLDLHDLSVELFISRWGEQRARILGPLVRLTERLACKFASHLITASGGFRERLLARGVPPQKLTLILNSADDRIFHPLQREFRRIDRDARLLYHGTVAQRFGIDLAIEAVALLQESIPGTALQIHSRYDPRYLRVLKERVRHLGLEDLISFGGFVSLEEISKVIGSSDIGVVPYVSDPFMDIALSTKAFEYVAVGLPVVASRLPSISSVFSDDCVEYFQAGDAKDMAAKIEFLCAHPDLRRSLTRGAFRAYEEISWPVMKRRYVDLVNSLTGRNGKHRE
ncbi:MAG TPA: glycosyltransferase family 4 protein, partial [Acidobacteriota bacterium]|nr:glycosyltransferase family 4 protein [Acidobacteriota bacterium]